MRNCRIMTLLTIITIHHSRVIAHIQAHFFLEHLLHLHFFLCLSSLASVVLQRTYKISLAPLLRHVMMSPLTEGDINIRRSHQHIAFKWKLLRRSLRIVVCGWLSDWTVTVATVGFICAAATGGCCLTPRCNRSGHRGARPSFELASRRRRRWLSAVTLMPVRLNRRRIGFASQRRQWRTQKEDVCGLSVAVSSSFPRVTGKPQRFASLLQVFLLYKREIIN